MKKNKEYSKVKYCDFSKKNDLTEIISLGKMPAVNNYIEIGKDTNDLSFYETEISYSKSSTLVQLTTLVNKEVLFPKSYPYTSSTTKILRDNFKNLYIETNKLINFSKSDLIVDIGSNDGNLLSNFKKFRVIGVTPENIGKLAIKKGIPTILSYFEKKTALKIKNKYGKAKLVCATNVFAHIENTHDLIKNIKLILDKKGVFISESHYLVSLIKTLQYDTIYHEHLRYYSISSLKYIFNKHGLEIFYCKKIKPHGGSIRVYASYKGAYKIDKSVRNFINYEKKFLVIKTFQKFKNKVIKSKINFYKLISNINLTNNIMYGVGAPSRGSILINYIGLDQNLLKGILETKGSYKIGKYLPGTKIPIILETLDVLKKANYLLILSWHIKDELKKILRKKGFKGKFIVPLPKPVIEN
jgi:SAM-dependent methyltransferase